MQGIVLMFVMVVRGNGDLGIVSMLKMVVLTSLEVLNSIYLVEPSWIFCHPTLGL